MQGGQILGRRRALPGVYGELRSEYAVTVRYNSQIRSPHSLKELQFSAAGLELSVWNFK
jgi:hypothetical protein